jgi:hypothetical protein
MVLQLVQLVWHQRYVLHCLALLAVLVCCTWRCTAHSGA